MLQRLIKLTLHRWTVIFTSTFDTVKLSLNAKFQQRYHPCCCPVIIYWRHTLEQLLQHHDPQWKKMLRKAFPATKGSSCQCDSFGPVHCSRQHVQVRWWKKHDTSIHPYIRHITFFRDLSSFTFTQGYVHIAGFESLNSDFQPHMTQMECSDLHRFFSMFWVK